VFPPNNILIKGGINVSSAKAMRQTMRDEFQIKGHWWLTDKEEKVSGILFYKKDDIKLELIGTLSKLKGGFANEDEGENPIILGISDKGEEFTLMGSFKTNFTISSPGFRTETYYIDSFVAGRHFNAVKGMSFKSIEFYPSYFSKWISKSPFNNVLSKNGKLESISFADSILFKEYVEPIKAVIEEANISNLSGDFSDNVIFNYKGGFKITPDEWKSFDWLDDVMYKLNNLYTLFINYPIYYESIVFHGEERTRYNYFIRQKEIEIKQKFKNQDVIITYREIQDNLSNIFNSWFEKQENLKVILDLYLSDFYTKSNLETRFLNSVQTLEIYHRRTYEGVLYDIESYSKYSSLLIDYAQNELPVDMAMKIKGMLQHGNEFSLSKRLRELVRNIEPETKKYFFGNSGNRDKFVQQLVDTRNYLTHYDKEQKSNILDNTDKIFYSVIRLKAFITLILFKEIGIDEKVIMSKIQDSKQYSYSITKAKELLN